MNARSLLILRPLRFRCWLVLLLTAGVCHVSWADPIAPGSNDAHITVAVASLLSRQHLSHHPLDKEISERCLKSLLKALDSMKFYFYQSDVDEFMKEPGRVERRRPPGRHQFRLHGLPHASCSGWTSG